MKFKINEKVKFKDPNSESAKKFEKGLTNLVIWKVEEAMGRYAVWENDKSDWHGVKEEELELE